MTCSEPAGVPSSPTTGWRSCGGTTSTHWLPPPRHPRVRPPVKTLLEDEARFIDLEQSALWLGQEIEIIPLASSTA